MNCEFQSAIARIKNGIAPSNVEIIRDLTVGLDPLTEFWHKHYLDEYIPSGGSRIQFLTGRKGSGKSHLIEYFLSGVKNYKIVSFSARKVWIHDFKEIFFEVLKQCGLEDCLRRCSEKIVTNLGYSSAEFDGLFTDYLTASGMNDPITKREIRLQLNKMFMHNPLMDNNFAFACAMLTGGLLGHPLLEEPSRDALLGWLEGRKDVKLSTLRSLGLSPTRIAKHNARHMLRSLIEVIKMAGYDGLIIAVDDLDILVSRDSLEEIRYTRLKREDVFESLRELIDEVDTLRNVFFLFSFDKKLIDDASGIKSYQALWFRIQNEIQSDRFNRFSSMIDMDRLSLFDTSVAMELSLKVANLLNSTGQRPAQPLDEEKIRELLEKTRFSDISLPRRIVLTTAGLSELKEKEWS